MQKIDYLQTIIFHLNLHHTPYRQDPNLGEDKGGLLGPKKDKYKVCSLLNKAPPNFGSSAANSARLLDIKTEV